MSQGTGQGLSRARPAAAATIVDTIAGPVPRTQAAWYRTARALLRSAKIRPDKEQDIMSETLTYQQMGMAARGQTRALFAQTMGYVAATTGLFALVDVLCPVVVRARGGTPYGLDPVDRIGVRAAPVAGAQAPQTGRPRPVPPCRYGPASHWPGIHGRRCGVHVGGLGPCHRAAVPRPCPRGGPAGSADRSRPAQLRWFPLPVGHRAPAR